jgi:hypothetical protein
LTNSAGLYKIGSMRILYLFLITTILFTGLISCTSNAPVVEPIPEINIIKEEVVIDEIPVQTDEVILPLTLNDTEIKEAETDIADLIDKLNTIITSKDYEGWKKYLSEDYISYYSNQDILKEKSNSPLLSKYKIVLRSLEDYFNYVVVGSRQNVQLDEIKALDRNRIKAYMFINNSPVIIYELIRIDDNWKIGKFLE